MNKLCIVGRNFETYFCKRLIEEVGEEELAFYNPWREESLPSAGVYLMRSTGIYGDDQDLVKLAQLASAAPVVNPLPAMKLFREKAAQYQYWQREGVAVLPWKELRHSSLKEAVSFFQEHHLDFGIVKPLRGQQGWGVRKLDREQIKEWWSQQEAKSDFDYLLQPFLKAREIRIFYIGDEWWTLERFVGQGETANFATEGKASLFELPAGCQDQVRNIIKLSGTHYGALDFLYLDGRLTLLELNVSPGTQQLELVTGKNILKQLLSSLKIRT